MHGPLWGKAANDLGSLNVGTADKPVPLEAVALITRSLHGGLILHETPENGGAAFHVALLKNSQDGH